MSKRTTLLARWCIALLILNVTAPAAHAQTVFPEWASRRARAWSGQPQLRDREAMFASAPEPEGRLTDALILCRVHVTGRWDLFADPDLQVRGTFGRHTVRWWGTENSRTEVFSVAGVSLRPGDRLSFRIVDRDVTFDETIGTVRGRYDGGRIALQHGHGEVECRRLPAERVNTGRERALSRAVAVIQRVESAVPDLSKGELGRVDSTTDPLIEAASWSGWSHPEVAAARRRHVAAEERFDAEVARLMREARRASPRPGRPLAVAGGTVRVESLACGAAARAQMRPEDRELHECVAVVVLTGDARLGPVDVLIPDGARRTPRVQLTPGDVAGEQRAVLTLATRPPRGALLRVGDERRLLRMQ